MPRKTLDFSRRLRALRQAAGISIYRLAQLTGLDRSYLGTLERGTKAPSLETASVIAQALGRGLDCWDEPRD